MQQRLQKVQQAAMAESEVVEKQAAYEEVLPRAEENSEEAILDILLPPASLHYPERFGDGQEVHTEPPPQKTREKLREQLRRGALDDRVIEIETQDRSNATIDFVGGQGMEEMGVNLRDMFGNLFPAKTVRRKMRVAEARKTLLRDEQERLIDMEQVTRSAIDTTEHSGIVFLETAVGTLPAGLRLGNMAA